MRFLSLAGLSLLAACGTGKIELGDTGFAGLDTGVSGNCPKLDLSANALEWAGTAAGTPSTQTLTLTNFCTGAGLLEVVSMGDGSAFSIDGSDLEIAPGESAELAVNFNPSDYDMHEGTLSLGTNEPDSPIYEVALNGRAQADMDGDGYEAAAAGGDDCDDANPEAYPGAEEVWYDGVDQNCDGESDYDQDGDGYDHEE